MRNHLAISTIAIFAICSFFSAASAEVLSEKAYRICHAYLDNPNDFKPVSSIRTCEVYFNPLRDPHKSQCFDHSVEAKNLHYAIIHDAGGTCTSVSVVRISEDNPPVIVDTNWPNVEVNGYGLGSTDIPLEYKGELLVTNGTDLRLLTLDSSLILCRFGYRIKGWRSEGGADQSVCNDFSNQKFVILDIPKNPKSVDELRSSDLLYPGELPAETHVVTSAEVDLNDNGKKELFLSLEYSSGRGCGYDRWSAAITNKVSTKESDSNEGISNINSAIMDLTNQGEEYNTRRVWSAVSIKGKEYIAENVKPHPLPAFASFSYKNVLDRVLYQYRDKKFIEICRAKPEEEKVVAHEIKPTLPFLYYDPLY